MFRKSRLNLLESLKFRVLNQISVNPIIRLKELNGDIDLNRSIVDELFANGYINITKMMDDDMNNLWQTSKGESFNKRGGYKSLYKKEKIEYYKTLIPNLIK